MQTVFLGNFKKIFQLNKNEEPSSLSFVKNLPFSGLGLCEAKMPCAMDTFEITKNISELLSPACGMTDEEKTAYLNRIMAK